MMRNRILSVGMMCVLVSCNAAGEREVETHVAALQAPVGTGWSLGTVGATSQRYPADFNVFSFGNASGFHDAGGPVAAGGSIDLSSISVNGVAGKPVGVVVGGDIKLRWGTITGDIDYGAAKDIDGTVTINGNTTAGNPIDFAAARTSLRTMAKNLKDYRVNGTTAIAKWGDINFTASDTDLNVFSVAGGDLAAAHTIIFSVPTSSTVIINVGGTSASIQNCGFTLNGVDRHKVLWNFYEATTVSMSSIQFPGSALAPFAAVTASWGAFDGTLVAETVTASCEFHWFPFTAYGQLTLATLRSPGAPSGANPWANSANYVNIGEKNLRFTWEPDPTAVSYRLVVLVPSSLYSIYYRTVCDKPNLTVGSGLGQDASGHVYYQFSNDDCPTRDIINEYWPGYPVHAWYVEETGADGKVRRSEWFYYYARYPHEIHVPQDQPTIQAAIDAASGITLITLADGTYTGAANKNLHWNGADKHLTIRCANGPASCIIDLQKEGRAFNLSQGQDGRDIIQGITIKNGWVKLPINQSPPYDTRGGGAVLVEGTSPMILDCVLRDNIAGDTEGVVTNSFLADGGAIAVFNNANPIIRGNRIEANYASHTGGGIAIENAAASIENNVILGNLNRGCYGGGGISMSGSSSDNGLPHTDIINNVIARNSTEYYATLSVCHGGFGGGITLQNSNPNIINNTIVHNTTKLRNPAPCQANPYLDGEGGGVRIAGLPYPVLQNNIIRDNQSGTGSENLAMGVSSTGTLDVSYSNLGGGLGTITATHPETIIDADPGFVDAAHDNFDLTSTSVCIDKGTPDWPVTVRSKDLAGRPRYRGTIDIGAYEVLK